MHKLSVLITHMTVVFMFFSSLTVISASSGICQQPPDEVQQTAGKKHPQFHRPKFYILYMYRLTHIQIPIFR